MLRRHTPDREVSEAPENCDTPDHLLTKVQACLFSTEMLMPILDLEVSELGHDCVPQTYLCLGVSLLNREVESDAYTGPGGL